MVSALLSLSSYVLGPDGTALDVKSHSASDGESETINFATNIACGLNVIKVIAFPVWTCGRVDVWTCGRVDVCLHEYNDPTLVIMYNHCTKTFSLHYGSSNSGRLPETHDRMISKLATQQAHRFRSTLSSASMTSQRFHNRVSLCLATCEHRRVDEEVY